MAEGKGLSKGCMVGLIVGGVIVVLAIIAGITCYMNLDELAKTGITTTISEVSRLASESPQEGVDVEQFKILCDKFNHTVKTDSTFTIATSGQILQSATAVIEDEITDADEARMLIDEMIAMYPELAEFAPAGPEEEQELDSTEITEDSAAVL